MIYFICGVVFGCVATAAAVLWFGVWLVNKAQTRG